MKKVKKVKIEKIEEKENKQKRFRNKEFNNLKNYKNFFIILCLLTMSSSQARSLGVWGVTFPVVEQDIKEFIYERLRQIQRGGEMKKINEEFIKNVKKHTLRPVPVKGLTTTDRPKTFYYDPTYILDRNIEDDMGNVIAKAGTIIKPLDTINLHGVLFFIDADDQRQIKWALENVKKYDYVKYILIRGNIKDAGNVLKDRIYFDQYGLITKRLGIKHVPCVVKQEGKKLRIEEFSLKAEANNAGGSEEAKVTEGAKKEEIKKR